MKGRDLEDRLVAYVRRSASVLGHGVLGRAHDAAGLDRSYLRTMPAGAVGMRRLRSLVEGCGMDASEAIRYALDEGGVARFVAEGRRLAPHGKDLPKAVRGTLCRMRAWRPEDAAGVDLESIDAARYEDPQQALRSIEEALEVVSGPKTYAHALGIWGSAQRGVYRLDYATMGIGRALEAAQAACDRALVADMLIRASYVLRDRGELDWALEVSDVLLELRASLRDHEGMGRALVVHGSLLSSAGDASSSVRCSRAALGLLGEGSAMWRFFALNHLSVAYAAQGSLDEAESAAASAGRVGVSAPDQLGRLAWARGRIARQRGDHERAVALYRDALDLLADQAIDAALVGAELVRAALEAGRVREAQALAASLSGIGDSVSEHPADFDQAISAGVLDLALAGLEAKVSMRLVSRVVDAIERGRAAATARLRRDLRL